MIKYPPPKIYNLNHFSVYRSEVLNTFVILWSYSNIHLHNCFYLVKLKLYTHLYNFSFLHSTPCPPPHHQLLVTTIQLSVLMNLTTLCTSCKIMQCLSFRDWLISLSTMCSGFIHVVAYVRISIPLKAE